MSLLLVLFSMSAQAAANGPSHFVFPTGERLYCADQNVYAVVINQMDLWQRRNPKCKEVVTSYAGQQGALRIEISSSATGCYTANINIQPGAGCAM